MGRVVLPNAPAHCWYSTDNKSGEETFLETRYSGIPACLLSGDHHWLRECRVLRDDDEQRPQTVFAYLVILVSPTQSERPEYKRLIVSGAR